MPSNRALLLLLTGAVLFACTTSTPTRTRWYRDGKPADPAALRAARDRCSERVHVATRAGPGENVEWGLAMIDCLREEGFVQVTEDGELAR